MADGDRSVAAEDKPSESLLMQRHYCLQRKRKKLLCVCVCVRRHSADSRRALKWDGDREGAEPNLYSLSSPRGGTPRGTVSAHSEGASVTDVSQRNGALIAPAVTSQWVTGFPIWSLSSDVGPSTPRSSSDSTFGVKGGTLFPLRVWPRARNAFGRHFQGTSQKPKDGDLVTMTKHSIVNINERSFVSSS